MIPNDPWARFWALGYRALVPIAPPGARLSPHSRISPESLGKVPAKLNGEGWTGLTGWTTRETTEADIDEWRDWGAGIGIVCRNGDLGIDCDTLDPELAGSIREEVDSRIGPLPLRVGQSPKALFYCRTQPGYRHPNIAFAGGEIEVRTSGQFVASGTHPQTLRGYEWVRELPPREALPWVAPETLDALWEVLRVRLPGGRFTTGISDESVPQEKLRGTLADVTRAVANIPNDYARREDYVRMGYAIKAALPDNPNEAWELYSKWCEDWEGENDPETVRRDWDGYRGEKRVGWSWLRDEANLRTRGSFGASEWFEEIFELPLVRASTLLRKAAEPQRWLVPGLVPVRQVTLLYGDGGTGKSLVTLQLCASVSAGAMWLGREVGHGRSLFITAEDEIEESHRRLESICRAESIDSSALSDLFMLSLDGQDAVLAYPSPKTGMMETTALYKKIRRTIEQVRPTLLVLDTLADIFGGDEIKRIQARQFVQLMHAYTVGLDFDLTVVIPAHPSVAGVNSGKGTSGSTAWNNSVRSRLYLARRFADEEGKREPDPDVRVMTGKKANRARAGTEMLLRWQAGRFVLEGEQVAEDGQRQDEGVFLTLLADFGRAGRTASDNPASHNYAPRAFAATPQGAKIGEKPLGEAMNRLFAVGMIQVVTYGAPSKGWKKIEVVNPIIEDSGELFA